MFFLEEILWSHLTWPRSVPWSCRLDHPELPTCKELHRPHPTWAHVITSSQRKFHDKNMPSAELCAMIPLPPLRKNPWTEKYEKPEGLLRTSILVQPVESWRTLPICHFCPGGIAWGQHWWITVHRSKTKKWCCCQNSVGRLHSKNTFNGKLTNPLGQVGLAQGQFFVGSSNFEMLNKEGGSGSTAPRLPESFVHRVGWIVSENILVTLNLERRFRSCLLLIPIDMDKYLQFYQSCRAKNIPAVFSYIELMLKFKLQFPIPQALQHWNSWYNPRLASHLL